MNLGSSASCCKASDEAPKQNVVEHLLVAAGQCSQLLGQSEGDHEVRDRQQQILLTFQPLFGLIILALGAVPVFTRVVAVVMVLAVLAQ